MFIFDPEISTLNYKKAVVIIDMCTNTKLLEIEDEKADVFGQKRPRIFQIPRCKMCGQTSKFYINFERDYNEILCPICQISEIHEELIKLGIEKLHQKGSK